MELPAHRPEDLRTGFDARGKDLRGRHLEAEDLLFARLQQADLTECFIEGGAMMDSLLHRATLAGAHLAGCSLSRIQAIESKWDRAEMQSVNFDQARLPGSTLKFANATGGILTYADLSFCDLSHAQAPNAAFDRASLFSARLDQTIAHDASFEYADLRKAVFIHCNFERASFVGASFAGATAIDCNFKDADFHWAEMDGFEHHNCNFAGARMPEPVKVAYGPRGVQPPAIARIPLYRIALTEEERKRIIEEAVAGLPAPNF